LRSSFAAIEPFKAAKIFNCPMVDRAIPARQRMVPGFRSSRPAQPVLRCGDARLRRGGEAVIGRLIEWSLRNRFLVAVATLFLVGWGIRAVLRTPVDAIPDLSENQVIVFADWPGRSPQEVEDQITYPLSVNLQGLAGVKTVRANSMFGFSLITVIFEDRVDNYLRARARAGTAQLSRHANAGRRHAAAGPDATGLGWVYQYYLEVDPSGASGAGDRGENGYDLGQCARFRIGSSVTSSIPCRAWPRSRAWADSCANIRSRSRRSGNARGQGVVAGGDAGRQRQAI
jgi:hypothetical protein